MRLRRWEIALTNDDTGRELGCWRYFTRWGATRDLAWFDRTYPLFDPYRRQVRRTP